MSMLSNIITSRKPAGVRMVIFAREKTGKTTFASSAPNALLIPLEVGYESAQDMHRTDMVTSYDQFEALMQEIIVGAQQGQFPYKSIVFDSVTALERLIHEKVLTRDPKYAAGNTQAVTMESALGGYGKAYTYANELFENFLKQFDMLAVYGNINIIITAHAFASKAIDPTAGEYDVWELLLHSPKNNKAYGKREMLTQWADLIGFLHEPIFIGGEAGDKFRQGITSGKGRILGVSRTPSYVAGNRYGIINELSIPAKDGWQVLAKAVQKQSGLNIF